MAKNKRTEKKRPAAFPESTLEELDKEKLTPSETYYEVVDRILKEVRAKRKEATA